MTHIVLRPNHPARWVPEWQRSLFVGDGGEVYVPAEAAPDGEQAAFLSSCFDGCGYLLHEDHIFLPLSWMRREFPGEAELWDAMERNARRGMEQEAIP